MIIEYGLVQRILALLFKSNPSIFKERRSEDEDVVLETQRVAAMVSTGSFEIVSCLLFLSPWSVSQFGTYLQEESVRMRWLWKICVGVMVPLLLSPG